MSLRLDKGRSQLAGARSTQRRCTLLSPGAMPAFKPCVVNNLARGIGRDASVRTFNRSHAKPSTLAWCFVKIFALGVS
jgi:hypothetical protein